MMHMFMAIQHTILDAAYIDKAAYYLLTGDCIEKHMAWEIFTQNFNGALVPVAKALIRLHPAILSCF